ncbi:GNAT family N-acetyltransferase [Streptococcus saliviloxodontae]|nr:GNAT family N-acetyltransferase [Streptococcus saliviloxodontae]
MEKLERMYRYLDQHGELFFIDVLKGSDWLPIGDVCLSPENLPIVIGDAAYRGQGIGSKVLSFLISRAREKGFAKLFIQEIYDENKASQRLFKSLGFKACFKTEKGSSYQLMLTKF